MQAAPMTDAEISSSTNGYVVVGGGQAGAKAVEGMREAGYDGPITLLAAEKELPYERPDLSKAFLKGEKEFAELHVHDQAWYDEHRVTVRTGSRVVAIDRAAHQVELDGGERLGYTKLLLATGSTLRRLRIEGGDLDGIHYLRTVNNSRRLREALVEGARVVVVGAGWIGLEGAAVARQRGATVTVVEPAPTPLFGPLGQEIGERFAALHRAHGVEVRTGTGVEGFEGEGAVTGVRLEGGEVLPADVVLVGVGIRPDTRLAEEAGLEVDNGVLVDEFLRTSDPDVYAAGDVANARNELLGRQLRVEHWANANDQGLAAGRSMAGKGEPWAATPFFFSDQYETGMEYRGLPVDGYDQVVVREQDGGYLAFWLKDGRVQAGANVDLWDDGEAIEALVRAKAQVDPARLADPSVPLASLAG